MSDSTLARPITACRACAGDELEEVFSLGDLPLGNDLVHADERGRLVPRVPLALTLCLDCGLTQLAHDIEAGALHQQYLYYTSASSALLRHGEELAQAVMKSETLPPGALVVEIGSSDGSLLASFKEADTTVVGIEPMAESARVAEERYGVPTIVDLFGTPVVRRLGTQYDGDKARVILANYVLELVPTLDDFTEALALLLAPNGVVVLEVPYLVDMVGGMRFDGIAHVRQNWFDVGSLRALFSRHGLVLSHVDRMPDFRGGTLRVWVRHEPATPDETVDQLLSSERREGVADSSYLRAFGARVDRAKDELRRAVADRRQAGERIAAYGGGIKASTVLNACQLGNDLIEFVVDGNPAKHGFYMPGVELPILPPDQLLARRPDYTVLLALDHTTEVLEQQRAYREAGGRFLLPLPSVRVS